MSSDRVLVYGGNGALGSFIISHFRNKNFWTLNVDLGNNNVADSNVVVAEGDSWELQDAQVMDEVSSLLGNDKLDAVFCVAGGWLGGNISAKNLIKNTEMVWKQSVWSSIIAARIAAKHLKNGGILQLTGAYSAFEGTPGMVGYGMVKASVHQLAKSLSAPNSGMPANSTTVALSPEILDTPTNRKWMSNADFSSWTPLSYIAELMYDWAQNPASRPANGSIVKLKTLNGTTSQELL